jgi:ribonucleoside-diphosphate reductase alpha chain
MVVVTTAFMAVEGYIAAVSCRAHEVVEALTTEVVAALTATKAGRTFPYLERQGLDALCPAR